MMGGGQSMAWMRQCLWTLLLMVALIAGHRVHAQDTPTPVLKIATKEAAPFATKGPGGRWQGISITLWENIATELGFRYEFVEADLPELLEGVSSGRFDAVVAALTVTPERERHMDFTHPFFTTGLGIAVSSRSSPLDVIRSIPWIDVLTLLLVLFSLMLIAGLLVWMIERRSNPDHFGAKGLRGVGAGLWWSAVTWSTVGYGDKAPLSFAGRSVAVIWMLASVFITTGFTAAMTSALTVKTLASAIQGPDDLQHRKVGSIASSSSAAYLDGRRIRAQFYPTVADGLKAVADGEIDAFVYDRPLLLYYAGERRDSDVRVLTKSFARQDYAIALPNGSPRRKAINGHLLRYLDTPEWQDVLRRWLGNNGMG
jgi:ABC-type amino acid transport substrate-binding protein